MLSGITKKHRFSKTLGLTKTKIFLKLDIKKCKKSLSKLNSLSTINCENLPIKTHIQLFLIKIIYEVEGTDLV